MLKNYDEEWRLINIQRDYYYGNPPIKYFKSFVYNLLYDKNNYKIAEKAFMSDAINNFQSELVEIIENENYKHLIANIDQGIISDMLYDTIDQCIFRMDNLVELQMRLDDLKVLLDKEIQINYPSVIGQIRLFSGDIETILKGASSLHPFISYGVFGMQSFINGDVKGALLNFEKGLKAQRTIYKGSQLPIKPEIAFYYLTALHCVETEVSTPIFQKINKELHRKLLTDYENTFKVVG